MQYIDCKITFLPLTAFLVCSLAIFTRVNDPVLYYTWHYVVFSLYVIRVASVCFMFCANIFTSILSSTTLVTLTQTFTYMESTTASYSCSNYKALAKCKHIFKKLFQYKCQMGYTTICKQQVNNTPLLLLVFTMDAKTYAE